MPLRDWHPPTLRLPSPEHKGEEERGTIYEAVGIALDEWETLELLLAQLFAVLCETSSAAARRAYGTISGPFGKRGALEAAAFEYFQKQKEECKTPQEKEICDARQDGIAQIIRHYGKASEFRNNIAHDMVARFYSTGEGGSTDLGYFLYAPPYATRKLEPKDLWRSTYFYNKHDIEYCAARFKAIAFQADSYVLELNLRPSKGRAVRRGANPPQ